ncbi:MAG TPA: hypothetical protein DEW46_05640, partial [Verrucomicrobia bacterium]|nr:hypothetical protein [Verrucomicrobiota bacterium]
MKTPSRPDGSGPRSRQASTTRSHPGASSPGTCRPRPPGSRSNSTATKRLPKSAVAAWRPPSAGSFNPKSGCPSSSKAGINCGSVLRLTPVAKNERPNGSSSWHPSFSKPPHAGTPPMSSAPSKAEYGAKIALVNAFTAPLDNAVAAARTCYSSRIISPEEVHGSPDSAPETLLGFAQKRDNLARDLLRAGHHTVFQHAYFQFTLEGVSRQFVWSFLHNHTFYNSEQVSQRYVPVREGSYVVPDGLSEARKTVFRATVQAMFSAYNDLCALLEEPTAAAFFERFPSRRNKRDKYQRAIQKKAMEAARYVLPVATRTHLYHTVSGITLLRYHQRCLQGDAPWEQTQVVSAMLNAVLAFAPEYKALIDPPLEPTHPGIGEDTWPTLQPADSDTELAHKEFDAELAGRTAHLVAASSNPDRTLALAVRQVLGLPQSRLSDEDAVRLCLDPAVNQHLAAELNLTDMDPISRAMAH